VIRLVTAEQKRFATYSSCTSRNYRDSSYLRKFYMSQLGEHQKSADNFIDARKSVCAISRT
jgi:hypothetical protein